MAKVTTSREDRIACTGGTLVIDDTAAHTGLTGYCIECDSDAVISVCSGYNPSGATYDFKASLNWVTLKAGAKYFTPINYYIDAITLTSGSISVHQI